jgi:hypothetical protein
VNWNGRWTLRRAEDRSPPFSQGPPISVIRRARCARGIISMVDSDRAVSGQLQTLGGQIDGEAGRDRID